MALIDEMTVAENQAKLANLIAYSPTNPDAFKTVDPALVAVAVHQSRECREGLRHQRRILAGQVQGTGREVVGLEAGVDAARVRGFDPTPNLLLVLAGGSVLS